MGGGTADRGRPPTGPEAGPDGVGSGLCLGVVRSCDGCRHLGAPAPLHTAWPVAGPGRHPGSVWGAVVTGPGRQGAPLSVVPRGGRQRAQFHSEARSSANFTCKWMEKGGGARPLGRGHWRLWSQRTAAELPELMQALPRRGQLGPVPFWA